MDLRPLDSHIFVTFFIVSERRGRKPPAERSTLNQLQSACLFVVRAYTS